MPILTNGLYLGKDIGYNLGGELCKFTGGGNTIRSQFVTDVKNGSACKFGKFGFAPSSFWKMSLFY